HDEGGLCGTITRALHEAGICASCGEEVTAREMSESVVGGTHTCPRCGVSAQRAGLSYLAGQWPRIQASPGLQQTRVLYGADVASAALAAGHGQLLLIEGCSDVWSVRAAGGPPACSYLGARLSPAQAAIAVELVCSFAINWTERPVEIVLAGDADAAEHAA